MNKKHLPNILTISRILVIPVIILLFYLTDNITARKCSAFLFAFACVTDFLDGYLARAWSMQTALGRFLDPIADKLLVGAVIIVLLHFDKIDIFPALAIICREILVSGLREFLAELHVSVPVSNLSKVKTGFQMVAIFLLLLGSRASNIEMIDLIGRIALWIAAILTLVTGYAYLKSSLRYIGQTK